MKNETIVAGLDIGTTKICVILGRKNEFGKLEILGMGNAESGGVTRGVVTNIEKTVQSIRAAIKEAEQQTGIKIGLVNVGIAGQHIKSLQEHGVLIRDNSETEINQEDIKRLIDNMYRLVVPPGDQIIHVMPQEFTVDHEGLTQDPVGSPGVRLEANFHIITGQISAINNISKCVKRAELSIDEVILEPLASSASVLSEEEKEAGVVLIDIGGGTTDLAIFHDRILRHTSVIPFGGNILTQDIKDGLVLTSQQAELLKIRFGSALAPETKNNEIVSIPSLRGRDPKEISVRNLAHIIQARMEDIIEHIAYEIHTCGYGNKLTAGIVLTGGGSLLQHISQLFEYRTGMDTRIGYPNEHLGKCKIDLIKSPMYSTGIGLVLTGFDSLDLRKKNQSQLSHEVSAKRDGTKDWFNRIINGTKKLLIDEEVDDTKSY